MFDDDDDYEEDDINNVDKVYKLRHYSNVYGFDAVCKANNFNKDRANDIINSYIHGSIDISFIRGKEEVFKAKFDEFNTKHYEAVKTKYEAEYKNQALVWSLKDYRKNALGIGTNKIKRRLNKINTLESNIIRLVLEIEDVNISAKKYRGDYKNHYYNTKSELISELISIYKENTMVYGIKNTNNYSTNNIIFFELNDGTQISWHNDIYDKTVPKYEKEWDGMENSTLPKVFEYIESYFPEIIF